MTVIDERHASRSGSGTQPRLPRPLQRRLPQSRTAAVRAGDPAVRRPAAVPRRYRPGRRYVTAGITGRQLRVRRLRALHAARYAASACRARPAARRRPCAITWRRIFIDGVSCSFSIVKASSATMKRRTLLDHRQVRVDPVDRAPAAAACRSGADAISGSGHQQARRGAGGGRHRPSPARFPAGASASPRSAAARHCRPCR